MLGPWQMHAAPHRSARDDRRNCLRSRDRFVTQCCRCSLAMWTRCVVALLISLRRLLAQASETIAHMPVWAVMAMFEINSRLLLPDVDETQSTGDTVSIGRLVLQHHPWTFVAVSVALFAYDVVDVVVDRVQADRRGQHHHDAVQHRQSSSCARTFVEYCV